jgi:hypothetical protein
VTFISQINQTYVSLQLLLFSSKQAYREHAMMVGRTSLPGCRSQCHAVTVSTRTPQGSN